MGYSRKNPNKVSEVERIEDLLFKKDSSFLDLSLCLCHWSFTPGNFTKLLYPLEFQRPKTKTHSLEIPHDFFLITNPVTWKFHFFFIDPSGIGNFYILFVYSIPLEIPCPQPHSPLFGFFWNGIAKLIKIDVTGVQHHELFLVFGKKWNKSII